MEHVAIEAEVAKGTLYVYFENKADLLTGILVRRHGPMLERFAEALADASDGLDLVARLIRARHAVLANDPPELRRLFLHRLVDGPPFGDRCPNAEALVRHVGRVFNTFLQAIKRGQQDGSIRVDLDPVELTGQLWAGTVGMLLLQQHGERIEQVACEIDVDKLADSFLKLLVDAIRAPGHVPIAR